MKNDYLENIAIVGCGLAGLTLAISLAEKGIISTIYEKEPEGQLGGMGIQITPNGTDILTHLGLAKHLKEISSPGNKISLREGFTSKKLFAMDLNHFRMDTELGYITCHRAKLVKILCNRAKQNGVKIRFNSKIILEEFSKDRVCFRTQDGKEFTSSLLIGADGYRSAIGRLMNPGSHQDRPDYIALRGVAPTDRVAFSEIKSGVNLFMSPGQHLVTYGINKWQDINFVAVRPVDEDYTKDSSLKTIISRFDKPPLLENLLNHVTELKTNILYKGQVKPNWYTGNVCLCGDSLHPMPPFLSQGGNMAIEDGWILASALTQSSTAREAFNHFRSLREYRLNRIVKLSNSQGWINHLSGGVMPKLRNWTLKTIGSTFPLLISSRYSWIYKRLSVDK